MVPEERAVINSSQAFAEFLSAITRAGLLRNRENRDRWQARYRALATFFASTYSLGCRGPRAADARRAAEFVPIGVPMETIEATPISRKRLVAFGPDPERGSVLYGNVNVKDGLADTFQQLFDASRSVANIDGPGFAYFLDQLKHARHVSPRLFAMYFDVLDAISRDDIEAVSITSPCSRPAVPTPSPARSFARISLTNALRLETQHVTSAGLKRMTRTRFT